MTRSTKESVQDYYGKVLKTKDDLQTSACCTAEATPADLRPYLQNVHESVREKFYGCGSPIPPDIEGKTILDLGCGSGQDAYMLSQLVGPEGHVIGIDMTEEQLAVANQYIGWHMAKFGYDAPNITFTKGYIEDLKTAGIEDASVDIVISNCVINLSPDKDAVFQEIFRALKPGGEIYFSDIFADTPVPENLKDDPVLLGECLSGAMTLNEFEALLETIGYDGHEVVSQTPIELQNGEIKEKIGMIDFSSVTVRAFKDGPCCGKERKDITARKTDGHC